MRGAAAALLALGGAVRQLCTCPALPPPSLPGVRHVPDSCRCFAPPRPRPAPTDPGPPRAPRAPRPADCGARGPPARAVVGDLGPGRSSAPPPVAWPPPDVPSQPAAAPLRSRRV
ncbi:MAG: hypothetical protein J3K34DRAFT_423437 [Monoraphidium minutum]|nr:MAG: hypothetical protein J3K34DRAFT_423437 [Monoraphidium minutum]